MLPLCDLSLTGRRARIYIAASSCFSETFMRACKGCNGMALKHTHQENTQSQPVPAALPGARPIPCCKQAGERNICSSCDELDEPVQAGGPGGACRQPFRCRPCTMGSQVSLDSAPRMPPSWTGALACTSTNTWLGCSWSPAPTLCG